MMIDDDGDDTWHDKSPEIIACIPIRPFEQEVVSALRSVRYYGSVPVDACDVS